MNIEKNYKDVFLTTKEIAGGAILTRKRQDNDCNFCLENEIRDSFETSRGILKIKTESNRSSTYIRLL